MANSTLTGKSVVVTGGLSGIGLALVRFFASYTPNIVINISILDISPHTSSAVLTKLRADFPHANFYFETCDISDWEQQAAVFKKIYQTVGSIDVVCANAGVTELGKFLEEGEEDAEPKKPDLRTLNVNLIGTLYGIRLGVFYMRKNPSGGVGKSRGLVLCTASNAGLYPLHIAPMYTMSKHGIVGAVRTLSRGLEKEGIRINAICPNCIETGLANDQLFSVMKVTPMQTLLNAVQELVRNESLTGVCAEISGEKYTFRDPVEFVDDITRDNLEAFWTLGHFGSNRTISACLSGILEDYKLEHVPGTAPLNELGTEVFNHTGVDSRVLKHDPTGRILLVPQPSDSPNDPYNWPRRKKELFTITYAFACGAVGAVGPLLSPAFVGLAAEFDISLSRFIQGVQGGVIVAIAFGSLIWNALAVKYGKRPVYLFTTLGLTVTCFWAAAAKSFASLVAARVIQGFCMAPLEALVPASIADVWFVHERGYRSAIFNLGVLGGINLAAPITGFIIQDTNYKVAFYAMGGAFGLALVMIFFWMPETAYHRVGAVNLDTGSNIHIPASKSSEKVDNEEVEDTENANPARSSLTEQPHSFAKEMLPYSGYVNHISLWRTMLRPFAMLGSPAVVWATLLFTTCISWLVGISITLSQIFSAPPYNFSVTAVGLTNLSSFVASIIATLIAGPLIDGIVKRMSLINGGTFEPEFRLPIMISYLCFTTTGFFAWGQSSVALSPWPVPVVVGLGLINFGIQLGTTGIVSYVVDCHREKAGEAFAVMNFVKNMFAFGLTNYLNNWLATQGVRNTFFTIGGLTAAASLTTIPMYIYGKRARSFAHRHNVSGKND